MIGERPLFLQGLFLIFTIMKRPRILSYRPSRKFQIQAQTARILGRTLLASAQLRKDALLLKSGNLTHEEFMANSIKRMEGIIQVAGISVNSTLDAIAARIDARMSIGQVMIVQSQPIPKFPPGGQYEGLATVKEYGDKVTWEKYDNTPNDLIKAIQLRRISRI